MKSRGFTLTELMATIVIIGVILGLTTGAYITVSRSIKQNNYNTKLNYIKSRATEYASDNNITPTTINVSRLIVEGYLTKDSRSDRENESITNPLGGYLDCYKIHISLDNNEYQSEIEENDNCSLSINDNLNVSVEVYKSTDMNLLGSNKSVNWSGEDVIVYVKLLNGIENDIDKSKGVTYILGGLTDIKNTGNWTNSSSKNHSSFDNEYYITTGLLLKDTYQAILYTKDNQEIVKEFDVKIDKEAPTLNVNTDNSWSNSAKKVTLYGSDGSGSGIYGYHIGNKVLTDTEQKDITKFDIKSKNSVEKQLTSGIYYVYARDNVGNVSSLSKIDINNIDEDGASCKNPVPDREPNANGWYNRNVTLTYGCNSDSASGCYTKDMTKSYVTDNIYNETINWQIKDTAGNTTNCSKGVSINLDKTLPACTGINVTTSPNYNGWYNHNVVASYGCALDNLSGCDYAYSQKIKIYTQTITQSLSWSIRDLASNYNLCMGYLNIKIDKVKPTSVLTVSSNNPNYNSNSINIKVTGSDDNSGVESICFLINSTDTTKCQWKLSNYNGYNYTLPSNEGSGQDYNIYAYVKDRAGNISDAAHSYYKMYKTCDETNPSEGECDATCGSGNKSVTYKDKHFGNYCSSGSTSCWAGECHYDDGGGDDDDGGGGCPGGDACWTPCDPASGSYYCCNGCCPPCKG